MANKINYSVSGGKATVGKNAGNVLYHPTLQLTGTLSLPEMAQHMSDHDSKYNEGDIYAVLVQFIKCIKEKAAQGYKVRLGDLGAFVPKIKTVSQTSAEDVTASDIRQLTLRWMAGHRTKDFKSDTEFVNVPKRKNQALLMQAEKSGQGSMTLAEPKSGNTSGTGNNDGTGGNQAGGE